MSDQPLNIRDVIPLFELPAVNRQAPVSSWDYKQRYSLAIAFLHNFNCQACCDFLLKFSQQYYTYRDLETEVLMIANGQTAHDVELLRTFVSDHDIPFPVLWDQQGQVRDAFLGQKPVGVFVCDRYGELYMQAIADEADQLPDEQAIREWVEYVDMQCAECFPPPWR